MERERQIIEERLDRSVKALNDVGVKYAVIGGNAVNSWLGKEGTGIQTRDVDLLLRRDDLADAEAALQKAGFIRRDLLGRTIFLDEPNTKARDAVHIVFASEKYNRDALFPSPDVDEIEEIDEARVIRLEALILMKLTAFRSRDRTHLIELLKVGLIDSSTIESLPENLKERFQEVLDEFESTVEEWEKE